MAEERLQASLQKLPELEQAEKEAEEKRIVLEAKQKEYNENAEAGFRPPSEWIVYLPVRFAREMHDKLMEEISKADLSILCAAVADFQPVEYADEKIKKGKSPFFQLKMKRTPDILKAVGVLPNKPFLVGFAAESCNVEENARLKLISKNCDLFCANDILAPNCGFSVPTNAITVFGKDNFKKSLPVDQKEKIANKLLDIIESKISHGLPG